jgi:ferredoxin-type protein NapG
LAITRREYVTLLAQSAFVLGVMKMASLIPASTDTVVVRPPGAIAEAYFPLLCVRCGICLEVCPTKAIMLGGFEEGIATVNTPKIDPLNGACEFMRGRCEESMRCADHCPTGALQRVAKEQVKLGTVKFNHDSCLAYHGKECVVCSEMCPVPGAIVVTEDLKPTFNPDKCVGCGTCVYSCPANPKALGLLAEGAKRTKWLG